MNAAVCAEFAAPLAAVAAPAVLFAAGDPGSALSILPVSAGLSGAVVAALKAQLAPPAAKPGDAPQTGPGRLASLLKFTATAGSGATAAVFGGPGVMWLVGTTAIPAAMLIHFLTGLLGSTLCDAVLAAGPSVGDWAVGVGKRFLNIPTPRPPGDKL